jgi:hypothetical protein
MPKPRVFRNEEELGQCLVKAEAKLSKWLGKRKPTAYVVRRSVGGSTFRSFRDVKKPSKIFRGWALKSLTRWIKNDELSRISDQVQYDRWLRKESKKLRNHWNRRSRIRIKYGQRSKLMDLLMKEVVRCDELDESIGKRLVRWLHVPLDKYTLRAVRKCVDDPRIPSGASMGFVKSRGVYEKVQKAVRDLAHDAHAAPILLDVAVWNRQHPQERAARRPLARS